MNKQNMLTNINLTKLSYVYLCVPQDRSGFKVGVSFNPLKRFLMFAKKIDLTSSIQFCCTRSNAFRFEKTLHFLFKKYRLEKEKEDGYTEWFEFSAFQYVFDFIVANQEKLGWIHYSRIFQPINIIDVRYISDDITLADRRIYNLLLSNAWDNIQEPVLHPIRLHELRSSNQDNARPRESLKRLMKVVVSFDVVEDGIKREVLTQLLGPCKLDQNPQGLAYYTFPEPIRNALESSSIFARLKRDVLCQFRSKYALSLYEMVQKRVNLSFKTSEDFSVEDLRQKLGVEKHKYQKLCDLQTRVLKPAVMEVNELSDIDCLITSIIENRKVTGLRLSWMKKQAFETDKPVINQTGGKPTRPNAPALRVVKSETGESGPQKTANRPRALNTRECEQLKKTFDGYDIYYFYSEFQDWLEKTGGEIPDKPAAAFTNWLKNYYNITGPLRR